MDNDEKVLPHVFEISMGVDRSLYTILEHSLKYDKEYERTVLSLKPYLSPTLIGVLSLVKKDGLKEKTDEVYLQIKRRCDAFLDHSGAIGRRYRRLDEAGTAICSNYRSSDPYHNYSNERQHGAKEDQHLRSGLCNCTIRFIPINECCQING